MFNVQHLFDAVFIVLNYIAIFVSYPKKTKTTKKKQQQKKKKKKKPEKSNGKRKGTKAFYAPQDTSVYG